MKEHYSYTSSFKIFNLIFLTFLKSLYKIYFFFRRSEAGKSISKIQIKFKQKFLMYPVNDNICVKKQGWLGHDYKMFLSSCVVATCFWHYKTKV